MQALKTLAVAASTASFELANTSCYYSEAVYAVSLNGKRIYEGLNWNVFSLYDLAPGGEYEVCLESESFIRPLCLRFTTPGETLCLDPRDFGAAGDGRQDDTAALQAAIMTCPPGGRVLIEAGTYLCRPLFLKSHITFELKKGAVLLGHPDRAAYPILPGASDPGWADNFGLSEDDKPALVTNIGSWEGEPAPVFASLLTGFHLENCAVIGEGTVDGNGGNGDWWTEHKVMRRAWRPKLVFLAHCRNLILQGLTFINSPSWTIHPFFSENLDLIDLKIINPKDSPNTDGINPESCRNVRILGNHLSVGDDCIAVKAGKFEMGHRFKRSSTELVVRNCLMEHGHGAVVLGSEMSGGIANLTVSQCLFINTDRGLRIKTRRGRGGRIDQIRFENIEMRGVLTPFVINMFYYCDADGREKYVWDKTAREVDERTPRLGSFSFKHIRCRECEVAAFFGYGLPEAKIELIRLEDVIISFRPTTRKDIPAMMSFLDPVAGMGVHIKEAEEVMLRKVKITGQNGAPWLLESIGRLETDTLEPGLNPGGGKAKV